MCHGCLHDPFLQSKIHECLSTNGEAMIRIILITGAYSTSCLDTGEVKGCAFILQKCLITKDSLRPILCNQSN